MTLLSHSLLAFLTTAKKGQISSAAETLGLTQAALSIRLKKLEEDLGETLFIRAKQGLTLTEAGRALHLTANQMQQMDEAYYSKKYSRPGELTGTIRVAAFSTIGRSFVLPTLARQLRGHAHVHLEFSIRELAELPKLLKQNEVDLILLDRPLTSATHESHFLFEEEYVLVQARGKSAPEVYLNHDEQDLMSYRYYESLGKPKQELKRFFLDEIYSVIDGVSLGLGKSVLPKHLIDKNPKIEIVNPKHSLKSKVYLVYKKKDFYPELLKLTIQTLQLKSKSEF